MSIVSRIPHFVDPLSDILQSMCTIFKKSMALIKGKVGSVTGAEKEEFKDWKLRAMEVGRSLLEDSTL